MTLSNLDALTWLGLRQKSKSLAIKAVSETARIRLVSSSFQAFSIDEWESVNIENDVFVGEPLIMRPAK